MESPKWGKEDENEEKCKMGNVRIIILMRKWMNCECHTHPPTLTAVTLI